MLSLRTHEKTLMRQVAESKKAAEEAEYIAQGATPVGRANVERMVAMRRRVSELEENLQRYTGKMVSFITILLIPGVLGQGNFSTFLFDFALMLHIFGSYGST